MIPTKTRRESYAEQRFSDLWGLYEGPELAREVRFHPRRRWRFDFAHTPTKTAIEIEGGAWAKGRHTRGKGFVQDAEKYLVAWLHGWTVIRLVPDHVNASNLNRIMRRIEEIELDRIPDAPNPNPKQNP